MNKPGIDLATVALGSLAATAALLSGLSAAEAQTAPGGGSFVNSFLVPGTSTSIGFHGFTLLKIIDDLGPHCGDTNCFGTLVPLEGPGVNPAGHSLNGGFRMEVKPSQFGVETRTPTAYGEVRTFFQFDVDEISDENYIGQASANGAAGTTTLGSSNGELFRLRMAYGTLGPILAGQANSNWLDLQSNAEVIDGGGEAGQMNVGTERVPQIRYTYLGSNGTSLAVSAESPQTMWQYVSVTGAAAGTTGGNAVLADNNSANGINYLPNFVATGNIDQPWGNFAFHGAIVPSEIRNDSAVSTTVSSNGTTAGHVPDIRRTGWAIGISGHLNTIEKDNFRGGVQYVDGAAMYDDDLIGSSQRQGIIWNQATGQISLQRAYSFWAGYQHWWTHNLRSTVSMGYAYAPLVSAARDWTVFQKADLQNKNMTGHLNLIWSPVPFVDVGIEWESSYRKAASNAEGRVDRINGELVFRY
jgi:hypothetical protein